MGKGEHSALNQPLLGWRGLSGKNRRKLFTPEKVKDDADGHDSLDILIIWNDVYDKNSAYSLVIPKT
jgi:hypothetical protein